MHKSYFKIILTSKESGEIIQYDNAFAYGKDFLEYEKAGNEIKAYWDPARWNVNVEAVVPTRIKELRK